MIYSLPNGDLSLLRTYLFLLARALRVLQEPRTDLSAVADCSTTLALSMVSRGVFQGYHSNLPIYTQKPNDEINSLCFFLKSLPLAFSTMQPISV